MDHLEAIVKLDNVINPEIINKLIPFIDHRAKEDLEIMNGVNKEIRNVKGHHVRYDQSPTDIFYWDFIKTEIQRLYYFYSIKFPRMDSNRINQIDLLKYGVGGKYNIHTDQFTNHFRHLSIIMNLNNEYEGGDLIFADQKDNEIKRLKLGKGSIVFFPSNFMYPHGIQPITKGTRYSIVAWLE